MADGREDPASGLLDNPADPLDRLDDVDDVDDLDDEEFLAALDEQDRSADFFAVIAKTAR